MNVVRTALLIFLAQLGVPQQRPSATVQGVVLKRGVNDPLSKATVRLQGIDSRAPQTYVTTTGDDGRFIFPNAEPGQYRIAATRDGYVRSEYGQRGPNGPGMPITLQAGQQLNDVRLAMGTTGAIHGRVYDTEGRPLANAAVQALKTSYQAGRRVLTLVQSALTNDLGEYRLFWLAPGSYYITAAPEGWERLSGIARPVIDPEGTDDPGAGGMVDEGPLNPGLRGSLLDRTAQAETFLPVYFPGATEERLATAIDLRAGANIGGIDVSLIPARPRRVRGVVVNGLSGAPAQGVELMRVTNPNPSNRRSYEIVDFEKGTFDIRQVIPGSYFLIAASGNLRGRALIEVGDKDLENVTIAVAPGFIVSGRVLIEDGPRNVSISNVQISLSADPPITGAAELKAQTSADGSFTFQNVAAGNYRMNVAAPPAFGNSYVKSIRLGEIDVLNSGLSVSSRPESRIEIVLGSNAGALEGRALSREQQPAVNVTVVLVPDSGRRQRAELYKSAQTDTFGKFRFERIPPGDYRVFAWEDVVSGAWQNPEFLRVYEDRGKPIQITEGGKQSVDAAIIPLPVQ